MRVDDDAAACSSSATPDRLEAEPVGVRHAADGNQHDVGLERLGRAAGGRLDGRLERAPFDAFDARHLGRSLKAMPCFSRMRWNCLATSASMPGRMRSRYSTTVTSRAEPPPDRAELQPDHAGADHHELARAPCRAASAPVEETMRLLVDLDAREARDVGAGGDDDVLGRRASGLAAVVAVTSTLPGASDPADALEARRSCSS